MQNPGFRRAVSMTNLASAARLLEGHPALMNLRLMQSVAAAQAGGNTLVLGVPGGFVPLENGQAAPLQETGEAQS